MSEGVAEHSAAAPVRSTTSATIRGTEFVVDAAYTIQKFIGCGSFGVVCSALDTVGQPCAIKKITNVFRNDTTAKRTLRELKLLLHFDHENVIGIHDVMCNSMDCSDLYVVTALMDTDLHKVIRSPQPLSDQHVQYFLYQLLRGMKYIHSCNVLHRDLKPSNLLVNENCDLKITDFGLSRGVSPSDSLDFLTEYVVTRWYRAPEIVLSSETYTKAVDVWSCGCIFAELLGRKPLFPGSDHVQQLNCILAVLGTPEQSQLTHVPPKARQYIAALPPTAGKPLTDIYPAATEPAIELLTVMLHWEPSKRCTIEEALAHPYLSAFHNPAAEPIAAVIFDFDVQEELEPKMALFREVCRFRPDLAEHAAQVYADPQRAKRSRQGSRSVAPPADAAAYAQNLPRYGEHQHSQMEQQPSVAQMAAPASV